MYDVEVRPLDRLNDDEMKIRGFSVFLFNLVLVFFDAPPAVDSLFLRYLRIHLLL